MVRAPRVAFAIKAVAFVAPIVVSILISLAISHRIDTPTTRMGQVGLWIVLSVIATAVLFVLDKVSRRLLPLSTLFGLSLVFPDEAPSRFRTALRGGTVNQLRRRIDDAKVHGLGDDTASAAETLVELAGALSIHDRLTRGHSERVRAYTKLIAEELDLDDDEVDRMQWAGLAHDVGKLFIDPEILNKPGRLTDDEYETIKGHTLHGAELVAPLRSWLGDALDGVDQHHERWDGNGYPYGLARTDISLAGRIVAVADVFDVITSVRSYKHAQAVTEARDELVRCSGTQFDPRVVRAFLNVGLGKLRLLVGPLSWLAQIPVVGRAPVGAAAAPAVAALGTSMSLLFGGFFEGDRPAPRADIVAVAAPQDDVAVTLPPPRTTAPTTTTTSTTSSSSSTTTTTTTTTAAPSSPVAAAAALRAVDDAATVEEDASGPLVIDVLGNDITAPGSTLTIVAVGTTPLGTTSTDGSTISFTPAANRNGIATITYTVIDDRGEVSVGTVTVRVAAVNDAPTPAADAISLLEDAPTKSVDVLANDDDPDGDTLRVVSVSPATLGTASTDGSVVRFTPGPDRNGTETLTYTVADPGGATATSTLRVSIAAVNDAPDVVAGGPPTVAEDSGPHTAAGWAPASPGGGTDESGQTLTATATISNAALFSALPAVDPTSGDLTFTPAADAVGTATLSVAVTDSVGATTTLTSSITITPVNDAPVAGDDTATVTEDDPATTITVLGNDTDIDGDPLTITAVAGATLGTATTDGTTITYTPTPDANGTDTLTTTIDDGNGATDTATLTITITAFDDAPTITVGADPTVSEDAGAQTLSAWATNIGPGGGPDENTQTLTATLTATTPALFSTQPALDVSTGDLTFTPADDANGSTPVTIDLDDGTNTATKTFTITITPVNDAPVAGDDDGFTTTADVPVVVAAPGLLTNDTDIDLDTMTVTTTPVAGPTQGSVTLAADGSFTYTAPGPSFGGEVQFTYEVTDGSGGADTATVTIQVSPVSGAGTFFLGSGSSSSTSPLTTTPAAPATPEPDYAGDFDSTPGFTIKASSANVGDTDVTKFQHWTLAPTSPVALRGPVRFHLWSTTAGFDGEDAGHYHVWLHDCADDGTDCDLIGGPTDRHIDEWNRERSTWVLRTINLGSIDRTIMPGRMLRMRLMFQHNDMWIAMSGSRPSSLELTLGNATPVAMPDTVAPLEDSGTTNIDVLANDRDSDLDPATVTITAPPAAGTALALGDGTIDYTAAPDQVGPDPFVYQVCDSIGQCDTSTVDLTVLAVNDAPTFQPGGSASADEDDGTTSVNDWATAIVAGPADEAATQTVWFEVTNDNPTLFVDQPTVESDGKLTFKGADDAFGTATVTVVLRDDGGTANAGVDASTPAVFTITINPLPDGPVAVDDVAVADQDFFVNIAVKQNDSDPDGDLLTVDSFTQGTDGTVTANGDGSLRYTPAPGFFGSDRFDYVITDGLGGFDTGRVDITVNRTPIANPDTYALLIGGGTLDVTANDIDDDPLSIGQVNTTATTGTVVCGTTDCTYTPAGIGPDSFTYRLRDPRGVWSGWVTVSILVTV